MRVLFCKIHPPFICFCKSSSHTYTPQPLKLESSPHVASTEKPVVAVRDDHHVDAESIGVKEESVVVDEKEKQQGGVAGENCVKSSLKKEALDSKEVLKKKVQWIDFLGKELAEIKEFEASETNDTDNESEFSKGCVCAIL